MKGANRLQDEIAHLAFGHREAIGVAVHIAPVGADLGFVVVAPGDDDAGDARVVVPLAPGVEYQLAVGGDQIGIVEGGHLLRVGCDARRRDGDDVVGRQGLDRLRYVVVAKPLTPGIGGSLRPENGQRQPGWTSDATAVGQGDLLRGNLGDFGFDAGPIESATGRGNAIPEDVEMRGEGGKRGGKGGGWLVVVAAHQNVVARSPDRLGHDGRRGRRQFTDTRGGGRAGWNPGDDGDLWAQEQIEQQADNDQQKNQDW